MKIKLYDIKKPKRINVLTDNFDRDSLIKFSIAFFPYWFFVCGGIAFLVEKEGLYEFLNLFVGGSVLAFLWFNKAVKFFNKSLENEEKEKD